MIPLWPHRERPAAGLILGHDLLRGPLMARVATGVARTVIFGMAGAIVYPASGCEDACSQLAGFGDETEAAMSRGSGHSGPCRQRRHGDLGREKLVRLRLRVVECPE